MINLFPSLGEIKLVNKARAIAIGALTTIAPRETSVDPTMKTSAPNLGVSASGLQLEENRKSLRLIDPSKKIVIPFENTNPSIASVSTVSYTHLDVYKRQGLPFL